MLLPGRTAGYLPLPDGAQLPYLALGDGPTAIAVIPGAGDGLTTVVDGALRLAWYYRRRAHRYRVLVLSRRQPIPPHFRQDQHAGDLLWALEQLQWGPTVLECNSAGGPVGQWMAVRRPDLIRGLILSSTLHRTVEHTRTVLQLWMVLAHEGRWAELNWSSIEYTFRPQTVARYRPLRPFTGLLPRPRYAERLERILEELLYLDNRPLLPGIACPTLVIGGADDRVIPADVQREMAALIPHSEIILYPGYGHGNDQENPDYERQVSRFAGGLGLARY